MSSDTKASDDVTADLVFEILSNKRRRMVLYYLRQNGGRGTVQEVAEQIAALENDVPIDKLSAQQRKRVYVSLYQTHVPKLDQTGIIDYDDSQGELRLTDRAMEFDSYLTRPSESTYPWQKHYFVLALLGAVVFTLLAMNLPGFAVIPPSIVGFGLVFVFGLSAVIHYWTHTRQKKHIPNELRE